MEKLDLDEFFKLIERMAPTFEESSWTEKFIYRVWIKEIKNHCREARKKEIRGLLCSLTAGEKDVLQQNAQKSRDAIFLNKGDNGAIVSGLSIELRGEELFLYPLPGRNQVCVVDLTQFMEDFETYTLALEGVELLDAGDKIEDYSRDEKLSMMRDMKQWIRDSAGAPFYDKKLAAECFIKLERAEEKFEKENKGIENVW